MYEIILTARAKKELKLLSKRHQISIGRILEELKDDPYLGKPLTRELTGKLSFRVGVYRIIYKVNKKDKIIAILTAGHRARVYE
jgi:mRNA interferase RelE/StbE